MAMLEAEPGNLPAGLHDADFSLFQLNIQPGGMGYFPLISDKH